MSEPHTVPAPVRIPADVEAPDRIAFGLTTRQLCIAAAVGVVLWLTYTATRTLVPTAVFLGLALPVVGATAAVLLIRRDGLGLDELLVAAIRQRRAPRDLAPISPAHERTDGGGLPGWLDAHPGPVPAPLRLPARAITADGVIDLNNDGAAVLAWCRGVNFALRSPTEQEGLLAGFAAWLHSLTGPVQIVIRSDRLDLTPLVGELIDAAPGMPHPALGAAAVDHAGFLADLGAQRDLLRRHTLLVLREPHRTGGRTAASAAGSAAGVAAVRRGLDAVRALAAAEVTVVPLDAAAVTATLRAAVEPFAPPRPDPRAGELAGADDVITAAGVGS